MHKLFSQLINQATLDIEEKNNNLRFLLHLASNHANTSIFPSLRASEKKKLAPERDITFCLLIICKDFSLLRQRVEGINSAPSVCVSLLVSALPAIRIAPAKLQNSVFSNFREIYRKPSHIISEPTVVVKTTLIFNLSVVDMLYQTYNKYPDSFFLSAINCLGPSPFFFTCPQVCHFHWCERHVYITGISLDIGQLTNIGR